MVSYCFIQLLWYVGTSVQVAVSHQHKNKTYRPNPGIVELVTVQVVIENTGDRRYDPRKYKLMK